MIGMIRTDRLAELMSEKQQKEGRRCFDCVPTQQRDAGTEWDSRMVHARRRKQKLLVDLTDAVCRYRSGGRRKNGSSIDITPRPDTYSLYGSVRVD